jgi:hypothetical protein
MAIPETQLETWSHQGSITQSSNTYNSIKNILEAVDTLYASKNYKVFLQGSYGNDTNIYAESDVDIVIRLDDCFHSDLETLPQEDKDAYKQAFADATYTYIDFKRDVLKELADQYGDDVVEGDKAIAIAANGSRRKADVIVATQFRRYYKFKGLSDQSYDEGICFFNSAGDRIANYSKYHSENCTTKHQNTMKWFKPMVRVLKNIRSRMIDEGLLEVGAAPSYYLEGLLYNVPDDQFGSSYENCVVKAINWIQQADKTKFVCANEQYYLLREGSHMTWRTEKCDKFLEAAIKLWNDW